MPVKKFLVWFIVLILMVGGMVASFYGWRSVSRALDSKDWPKVDGKIIESGVEEKKVKRTGSGTNKTPLNQMRYRPQVAYKYSVDGEIFLGSRISYADHGYLGKSKKITIMGVTRYSSNEDAKKAALKIANKFPKGKKITVYYMPQNPSESLLEPGFSYKALGWPLVGVLMIGIGGFIAWLAVVVYQDNENKFEGADLDSN